MLSVLCSVCAELNRGGNAVDKALMGDLAATLSSSLLRAHTALLDTIVPLGQMSQDGAVQMLFDVNFISDVLSARGSLDAEEHRQYTSRLDQLRTRLKDIIDPFDFIIFEKPLQVRSLIIRNFVVHLKSDMWTFIRVRNLHTTHVIVEGGPCQILHAM